MIPQIPNVHLLQIRQSIHLLFLQNCDNFIYFALILSNNAVVFYRFPKNVSACHVERLFVVENNSSLSIFIVHLFNCLMVNSATRPFSGTELRRSFTGLQVDLCFFAQIFTVWLKNVSVFHILCCYPRRNKYVIKVIVISIAHTNF